MSRRLYADLERWEGGQLSLVELEARHPRRPVRDIAALHASLSSLRTEPTPAPAVESWTRKPNPVPPLRTRLHRPMIVAAALTVLSTSLAVGLEPVRSGAASLLDRAFRAVASGAVPGVPGLPLVGGSSPPLALPIEVGGVEDQRLAWYPSVAGTPDGTVVCRVVEGPLHGRAAASEDCSLGSYVPDGDFAGTDRFLYVARTEQGASVAAVRVIIASVNDPPVATGETATTDEDVPVTIPVLGNDRDPDGDSRPPTRDDIHDVSATRHLQIRSVFGAMGDVSTDGGRLTYTPPLDFHGNDVFRYALRDGGGGEDAASVRVTVVPVNDPPLPSHVEIAGQEDAATDWTPSVRDVDGDSMRCSIATPPDHGVATVAPDCSSGTFRPDLDHHGKSEVTYEVSDGAGSVEGTVTVDVAPVNDPPVVEGVAATVDEDASLDWKPKIMDVDGDDLVCTIADPPARGHVSVAPDCSSGTYAPDPNFHGDDGFSFTVSDANPKTSVRGEVAVSVTSVNDPPVAGPDAAETLQGVPVGIAVLENDTDVEGGDLILRGVGPPVAGRVTASANGTVTYLPYPGFSGVDRFEYTVVDPDGGTAIGTVAVTVTPAPLPAVIDVRPPGFPTGGSPGT
jgi:hypothetical protein